LLATDLPICKCTWPTNTHDQQAHQARILVNSKYAPASVEERQSERDQAQQATYAMAFHILQGINWGQQWLEPGCVQEALHLC
jgi:hypothetical protein